jgi:diguanylate cyclase (GGDEF)-like protein
MALAVEVGELRRQAALYALGVLDTEPEKEFDRVARLAKRLLSVPSALVSFMDHDRQWYKAREGVDTTEVDRSLTFCTHVVADRQPLVVADAREDGRFSANPYVLAEGGVRFYAGVPIHSPDGHALGTVCVFDSVPRDLESGELDGLVDLAAVVEDLIAARLGSTVDELTGVQNRQGFVRAGEPLLVLADRAGLTMTMGFFDVNGLKQINDELGHEAGDRAIGETGRLLSVTFRSADVIARLGGDEFAVLFAASDLDGSTVALQRFLAALEELNRSAALPFELSVAAGFAERGPGGISLDQLLAQADASMYRAKGEGRETTPARPS